MSRALEVPGSNPGGRAFGPESGGTYRNSGSQSTSCELPLPEFRHANCIFLSSTWASAGLEMGWNWNGTHAGLGRNSHWMQTGPKLNSDWTQTEPPLNLSENWARLHANGAQIELDLSWDSAANYCAQISRAVNHWTQTGLHLRSNLIPDWAQTGLTLHSNWALTEPRRNLNRMQTGPKLNPNRTKTEPVLS